MESTSLAEQERVLASDWGGGKSPFGTSWSKFMMWIFHYLGCADVRRFSYRLRLHAPDRTGMAGADGSLQPVADHFHDIRPDQQQRCHGHGRQRRAGRQPEGRYKVPCRDDLRWRDLPGLPGLRMVALHFRRRDPDAKSMGSPAVCGLVLRYYRVSTVSTCSAG